MAHRITPPSIPEELLAETERLWNLAFRDTMEDLLWNGWDEEDDLWPTE